jgi:DNA-binding transcriptional MerR regulator
MSVLARMSGVPAATIKHYLREGLLPTPDLKTGRNMAYYDPALVDRIRRIKTLQREHFLPLRLIKSVLDGQPSEDDDAEAAAAIQRALASMAPHDSRTRDQLVASGLPRKDLAFFESLGIVTAVQENGEDTFRGDDLSLLRILGESRRAGITPEMLPADILGRYVAVLGELVRVELDMFRTGVVPRAGADLAKITDAATRLSEQLVVLVRRKMLLPTLRALVEEHASSTSEEAGRDVPSSRRAGTRRTGKARAGTRTSRGRSRGRRTT